MNKNAIKKFAIEARRKLIDSVTDKAGMLGITEKLCSEPITKGADFEVYQTVAGTEVMLNKRQCEQRRRLVSQIESRGFEAVVEEVAYTWFNRICAIRFMEVNDYLPNRVRVLSSEKEGKIEPDLVTQAPDVDLDLTVQEKEEIINWKISGTSEDTDKLYCKLFLKQCHQLHDILPGLFEADSDYMELLFGISYTNKDDVIYMLVNPDTGISEEDFDVSALDEEGNPTGQVEIIGWLYQYYNIELKDDTFAKLKKNIKITKERIPAATQLFTPDWIVRYMVENSVGRIWIEHLRAVDPGTDEKATAERFGWKYYLPEAKQEEPVKVKLAQIRTTYKDLKPTNITCIDPCMGSGHILIAMFDVLMDIYESAGYDKREAAFEIVKHNIHGLDIDQRAYQLAYFAVMMKGRGYNRRFLCGRDGKPEPKVYAIVESNDINRNHLQFFGTHMNDTERTQAQTQIELLLNTFTDAREYGSILNVDECDWEKLEQFVEDLDTDGQISFESMGSEETQNQLRKLVRVAKNLGQKYDAVVTNPPYMGSSNMSLTLSNYVKQKYNDAKGDLYAVFIERNISFLKKYGFEAMVTQHTWMFITSFESFRKKILEYNIVNLQHHGTKAFEGDVGTIVQTVSFVIRKSFVNCYTSKYMRLLDYATSKEKEKALLTHKASIYIRNSEMFNLIPGNNIAYWLDTQLLNAFENEKIEKYALSDGQTKTGNNDKYLRKIWEIDINKIGKNKKWAFIAKGGSFRKWYGNIDTVIDWSETARKHYKSDHVARIAPEYIWFKHGFVFNHIAETSKFAVREIDENTLFETAAPAIFIEDKDKLYYIMGYLNTWIAREIIVAFNPTFNTNVRDITTQPIIWGNEEHKDMVISKVKKCISVCKDEWDSFETSSDFKQNPLIQENKISEALNKWSKLCEKRNSDLEESERVINDYFSKLYSLLESKMNSQITIAELYHSEKTRDIKYFISYSVGCMFGRYSLDEEGLIYAGGEWDGSIYQTFLPDNDNCIPITDEEYFSDDIVRRFIEFVKTVYGADTLEENLDFIANALGNKGDTSREVIRNYFLKDFYADHLKVYQKRPIYWLFDSGKQNGFKALIYMHRYEADTVGRVRTDYLHRAQKYVETAMQSAQYTIDNASSASEKSKATKAVTKYTKQLAEMKIYDEAIAHIANKRIEIDLDDGVKVNYAKFQGVEVAQEGKKALKVDLLAKIK